MPQKINIAGERYGRLIAIEEVKVEGCVKTCWICKCDCGNDTIVHVGALRAGKTKTCGYNCIYMEKNQTTHGMTKSPEYNAWHHMRARCYNVNHEEYKNYGGRGIIVCDRWLNSFENFLLDVGLRPTKQHSLDRPNNDGNYEPGNIRWATIDQQARNQRRNVWLEYDGTRLVIKDWAKQFGVSVWTIERRFNRGESFEEIARNYEQKSQAA